MQDTVKISNFDAFGLISPERGHFGCSSCTVFKGSRLDPEAKKTPVPLRSVDGEFARCPSVVVTTVLPTTATVLWSCSSATPIRRFYIDVLLGDSLGLERASSVASFTVDGSVDSFVMPAGTLCRAHGPYSVKVVAEAESVETARLSNAGVSPTFFTESEQPGTVSDLRADPSWNGPEVELKWEPPEDDGGSKIGEYEVTVCCDSGPSQTFTTGECNLCVSRTDLESKGLQPVRAEVRARNSGSMPGQMSYVEIAKATSAPAPRAGSLEEPSAEPLTGRDVQEAASPWLGTGWEQAFVVQASTAFEPTGDNSSTMLRVRPGDSIQVMEQHSTGWTYCKNLSLEPECSSENILACSGWVPDWVVKAKKARNHASKSKSNEVLREDRRAKGAASAA